MGPIPGLKCDGRHTFQRPPLDLQSLAIGCPAPGALDRESVQRILAGKPLPGRFLDFRDPWGNRIEIVPYDNIQFTKAANVLRGMGLTHLSKNASAVKELTDKGMAPD